jgi:hypothetical protein
MILSKKCNFHISAQIAGLCLKQCQLKDKNITQFTVLMKHRSEFERKAMTGLANERDGKLI